MATKIKKYERTGNNQQDMSNGLSSVFDATDDYLINGNSQYEVGDEINPELLGDSAVLGVNTDGETEQLQMDALKMLQDKSKTGLSLADKAALAESTDRVNSDNRARQDALAAQFAARGGGSGLEAIARTQATQDATNREAQEARATAARAEQNRESAISALGELAANKQQTMYSRDMDKAQATDSVAQYNNDRLNAARQANWNRTNQVSDQNVQGNNQFAQNKLAAQKDAGQLLYNAGADAENQRLQKEAADAQKKSAKKSAIGSAVGAVAGGIAGSFIAPGVGTAGGAAMGSQLGGALFSDEKVKKDVKPEDDFKIEEFVLSLQPKSYQYKGENKDRHGIVAQDLEHSEIGRNMVRHTEDGTKVIDAHDAISAILQAVAHINKKVDSK